MDPYEYKAEGKEERDRYGHNFSFMSGASAIYTTQTFPPYSHTPSLPPLSSPSTFPSPSFPPLPSPPPSPFSFPPPTPYFCRGQRQGHKGAR